MDNQSNLSKTSSTRTYHAEELAEFLCTPMEIVYWLIENNVITPTWLKQEPWFTKEYLDSLFSEIGLRPIVP